MWLLIIISLPLLEIQLFCILLWIQLEVVIFVHEQLWLGCLLVLRWCGGELTIGKLFFLPVICVVLLVLHLPNLFSLIMFYLFNIT